MKLFLSNTIINFHAVYDKEWMRKVLKLISSFYHMISANELIDFYYNGKQLKNSCHITFDDGDVSFYTTVFPLLKEFNIPASVYVSPRAVLEEKNFWFQEIADYERDILVKLIEKENLIKFFSDKKENLMAVFKSLDQEKIWDIINKYRKSTGVLVKSCVNLNKEQLVEISGSPLVEVGAHTLNHPILKNEDDDISETEISKSIELLGNLLKKEIRLFTYPNGKYGLDFSEREMKSVQRCGIKLAFSTINRPFRQDDNPYCIPRNSISKGNSLFLGLKLVCGTKWDSIKKLIKSHDEEYFRYLIAINR